MSFTTADSSCGLAGRVRALLLISVCLLALAPLAPTAFTQEHTRPRTINRSVGATGANASDSKQTRQDETASGARQQDAGRDPQGQSVQKGKQDAESVSDDEVVTINASEVLVPATVRDASGQLVADLTRRDFRVFEDGREQPLSDLSLRQVPVDVALLVDASSSVADSFEDFRRAAEQFAARLSPDDRFCLVKFDDRVELLLDWTKSRLQLRRALARLSTGVFTRFNDALLLSAREQFQRGERRRALVVLSDGIDSNRGSATADAAMRALLESQVAVYVIANTGIERARKQAELDSLLAGTDSTVRFNQLRIGDLREGLRVLDASERNLAGLTSATGGRLYKPQSFDALDRVYTEIADELRHQYALYYTPTNPARDGRFRRVRVEVPGHEYEVTTRVGYYAPRR
ncbi:MAG TPA: VWA domain-containing protein [Pyrinomonadaceae bacterium]|nr:VWA domain-containing protein [Pyrinomonadaceae bacterium]